jgi:hypothetical protein
MARLGELLIAARLLDTEQVERALQAQVLWGGRLGTNLIELGLLDLDGISRALGRQHGVPAALAKHFEKSSRELQDRLPAEIAKQWSVVPLLHVGPRRQLAVAVLDPLPAEAVLALADAFGCAADGILQSVAAEMRVRYHLERVYAIARPARFLRLKGPNVTPFPQFDNVPVPVDSDAEVAVPITVDETAHPTGRASDETTPPTERAGEDFAPPTQEITPTPVPDEEVDHLAKLIDDAIAAATAVEPTEPVGRDRRHYVRTLADGAPARAPAPEPETPPPPEAPATPAAPAAVISPAASQSGPAPLGRMTTIKKPVQEGKSAGMAKTLPDATRAIRRARNRDHVGELVIDTLERLVPGCDAAVVLAIRGDVAIGWKQFSRTCTPSQDIAVPLDEPGLVPTAKNANVVARGTVAKLTPIDQALMRSLGDVRGELVVIPIAIADNVMALLAITTQTDGAPATADAIAGAASAAFARLIRDASR